MHNDLLLCGHRIVVPVALQDTLWKGHEGHQGIEHCRARAKASVWWPGVINETKQMVQRCPGCAKEATPRKVFDKNTTTRLPIIGSDLFEMKGSRFLLVVDYNYTSLVTRKSFKCLLPLPLQ